MPNHTKEMQDFENAFVKVLQKTGSSDAKGSILWRCLCKYCGNEECLLNSNRIKTAKGCTHCHHQRREYPEVERLCTVCGKPFKCPNNTRSKTCSSRCKKALASQRVTERLHSSVERKLRGNLSGCLSRRKFREESSLNIDRVVRDVEDRGWRCLRTGIPFEAKGPFAPSVDRIDSNLPYTEDNIQVVCWIYNRCKNSDTDEVVETFARKLIEHLGE